MIQIDFDVVQMFKWVESTNQILLSYTVNILYINQVTHVQFFLLMLLGPVFLKASKVFLKTFASIWDMEKVS